MPNRPTYVSEVGAWRQQLATERRIAAKHQSSQHKPPAAAQLRSSQATAVPQLPFLQSPRASTPFGRSAWMSPPTHHAPTALPEIRSFPQQQQPAKALRGMAWHEPPLVMGQTWNEPAHIFMRTLENTTPSVNKCHMPLLPWKQFGYCDR